MFRERYTNLQPPPPPSLSPPPFELPLSENDSPLINDVFPSSQRQPLVLDTKELDGKSVLGKLRANNVGRLIIGYVSINSIRNKFEDLVEIVDSNIDILRSHIPTVWTCMYDVREILKSPQLQKPTNMKLNVELY